MAVEAVDDADDSYQPAPVSQYGPIDVTQRNVTIEHGPVISSVDEEAPLLPGLPAPDAAKRDHLPLTNITTIVTVLLLGELVANLDATLVMAGAGRVSSDFNRLRDANWLSTGYSLGVCTAQAMYGKLSDTFGRKAVLLVAYLLFGVGCLICGIGPSMEAVIAGRIISGIGGAGIMTVSSIVITDIVPKREIASWRGYISVVMAIGRSSGGPLGGWLIDTIGWRWIFFSQVPLLALAGLLVILRLTVDTRPKTLLHLDGTPPQSIGTKLKQIDFLGTFSLAAAIVTLALLLDQGGKGFPWQSWWTFGFGTSFVLLMTGFVLIEAYVAPKPIYELRILRQPNVALSYLIGGLHFMAQVSLMFLVPLYFQITQRASATRAGLHLVPAVVGNALGALCAGAFIRRVGHYKLLLVLSGLVGSVSHVLLFFRWTGNTGFWESWYIFPGGYGTGMSGAAAFIAMASALEPQDIAMATAGFMLVGSLSITIGVTISNSVLSTAFRSRLQLVLDGPDSEEIIRRALADTGYIASLKGSIRHVVVNAYIFGLDHTYTFSFACTMAAAILGCFIRVRRI